MGQKSRMKWAMREEEGNLDQATQMVGALEATLTLALEAGARNRDRMVCVTIWTAKEGPTEADQEHLHEYMQEHHRAGFVGTMGWRAPANL